ncbi:MAG: restriction endonuclease, partial [Magnetovibrio sp.]|nr:restriction endonuclease [Magnetovibrio sp.]
MSIPSFQAFMLPVLEAAKDGEISISEVRDKIALELDLTDEDISELLPSGRQTYFVNRVSWARHFIEKALLVKTTKRGYFQITPRGKELLTQQPDKINIDFLLSYPEFAEWREAGNVSGGQVVLTEPQTNEASTPEENIEANYATLHASVRADVMDRIKDCSWQFFERLIVDLLLAMGYGGGRSEMGEAFTKSGDGGIDGVIKEDSLGLDAIYIQAKKYDPNKSVRAGRPDLQRFVGSLDGLGATKGLFVCLSGFTSEARDYVRTSSKRIILVDGEEPANLMIRHNVGVRVRDVYELKGLDEDY